MLFGKETETNKIITPVAYFLGYLSLLPIYMDFILIDWEMLKHEYVWLLKHE